MNSKPVRVARGFFASSALFCLLVPSATTTAYSQSVSQATHADAAANPYAVAGEGFLSSIHEAFLQDNPPAGFNLQLYAETIDPNDGTKASHVAFLWTQDQVIRALTWGAQVDLDRFKSLLSTAVDQTNWYQGGCGTGFGTTKNSTCFYDDNALLGGILMDAYLQVSLNQDFYNHSRDALNYVFTAAAQDPHGGVPQVPAKLGQGLYYMNVVVQSSLADTTHGIRFNNSDEIAIGRKYFEQVNDPALGLITAGGLFKGGTQFVNGAWQPENVGPLAGDSTNVADLALGLYRYSGDPAMLQYAENLMDLVVAKWVAPNGAVSQNAVNGGYAIVNTLCQLYEQDHNEKYYNDAKGIIDFLLNDTRDRAGYFPNGTSTSGNWDNVRTGMAPDDNTTLLTQAAAAAAILEFAYTDIHKHNMSDINGDGAVNLVDFKLVLNSLGKYPGQQEYRPAADVNDDGVVNGVDLAIVARNVLAGYCCTN